MCKPLLNALQIGCSLLFYVLAHPAAAHNGRVALAYPVQGITVDGDLSDWPKDLPRYPIASRPYKERSLENISTVQNEQDLMAFFRAGYNAGENVLYLAMEVQDQSIVAIETKYNWGANDMGAIVFDLHHGREHTTPQAYAISGVSSLFTMLSASSTSPDRAQAVLRQDTTRQYYEWRFDIGQITEDLPPLQPGMVLGFETAVGDVDADTSTTFLYWGPEGQPLGGSNMRLGDLLILGDPEHTGDLKGQIRWPDGSGAGRIKVEVQAIGGPKAWLQIRTDRAGRFSTPLPPGRYQVRALREEQEITVSSGTTSSLELKGQYALGHSVLAGPGKTTHAGSGLRRGKWRSWDASDGLIDETIRAIVQDRDGAMWFGAGFGPSSKSAGLVHYNGEQYTHFAAKDGFTAGNITALVEDRNGHIWIGAERGLVRYDGERFTTYTIEDGLPADYVLSLFERKDGSLWIGTLGGVARYDGEKFTNFTEEDGLPASTVKDITEDRAGNLWLAASGLVRYDGKTWHTVAEGADLVSNEFTNLGIDSQGHIWVCADDGVLRYDGAEWQTVLTDSVKTANSRVSQWSSAIEDDLGRFWLASFSSAIKRLDGEEWVHFDARNALVGNSIMTAYKDREGRLWFASRGGGIGYYDEEFAYTYTTDDGLPDNVVKTVIEDRAGQIWFGTGRGLAHFENGAIVRDLPGFAGSLWSVREDPQDGLWFTIIGRGVVYYNGSKTINYTVENGLADNITTGILPDSHGHIWVRYLYGSVGVSRYDGEKWQIFTTADGLGVGAGSMVEDRAGQIWFGTNTGLSRFDGERFTEFTRANGLPHNKVSGLVFDSNGDLWFGFAEGGLARYHSPSPGDTDPRFNLYDLEQKYTTGKFLGEIFDDRGHLWLRSWGGGVLRYDGLVFQKLRRDYGLPNSGIQDITQTRDGAIWIAHEGGVTRYISRHTQPTLQLRNVAADQAHGPVAEIDLPSTQDYLLFEFQGVSLNTAPDDFVYVYRLEGYQDEWRQINTNRVEFHDLPVGEYRFEAKAVDHDLNYSKPVQVAVQIHLPYERFGWISSLALALLLAAWQGARVVRRDRALRQSNEQLEQKTEDLEKTNLDLEKASRAKSEFLANISHEIRTPMNAILGYAQLLRHEELSTSQRTDIERIQASGNHLLGLINEVLDLSKIEAGQLQLNELDFDLNELVVSLDSMFAWRCEEKGLAWELSWDSAPIAAVRGDASKLAQVLINLLGNAVKFSEAGKIALCIAKEREQRYCFEVRDTGIGISAAEQTQLFQAFQQGEAGAQRGGTGLGLAIARQLVELMGGELQLASAPGKGSTFSFSIMLAEGSPVALQESDRSSAQLKLKRDVQVRALVADDMVDNRAILRRMLEEIGLEVELAENGREALGKLENGSFDIVFLDIRMPVMDGREVVRAIRERREWHALRVVAISASVLDHERSAFLAEGFDDFVGKPFEEARIAECLRGQLQVELIAFPEDGAGPPHESEPAPDLSAVVLPAALHTQLLESARLSRVTAIDEGLRELDDLGARERQLADYLRVVLRRYDMDGIVHTLESVPMTSPKPEILLIDDQPANLDVLCRLLERTGYAISVAHNGPRGIEVAQQSQPDLVLLDVVMPGMDGYEVCRQLKADQQTMHIPVIFITGRDQQTDLLAGFTVGGVDYIAKPIEEREVLARVQTHVQLARLMGELARTNEELRAEIAERQRLKGQLQLISAREADRWGIEGFIGRSKTMQAILAEVQLLQEHAKTSVLITGESGTGKELIARAIHLGGARRDEAFVAINCAAIPGELGESVLFGHAKGAFTGATSDRPGYFEMADGGTLFLDEIGEMPMMMQAKILRVLEDGEVWRVGDQRGRRVDVRIIAATNVDLEKRIAQGTFREDLYYRIAAYTVKAPALRERTDDIELLVQHFLQMFADEMGVDQGALSDEARNRLEQYPFPGNVRELKNVIERAVLESRGGAIEIQHLHLGFSGPTGASNDNIPPRPEEDAPLLSDPGESGELPRNLDEGIAAAEVRIVEQAVKASGGNVSEAARLLGTSRTRLYRILREHRKE